MCFEHWVVPAPRGPLISGVGVGHELTAAGAGGYMVMWEHRMDHTTLLYLGNFRNKKACVHVCVCACLHMCMFVCARMHVHVCVCACMCACMCVHARMCVCARACVLALPEADFLSTSTATTVVHLVSSLAWAIAVPANGRPYLPPEPSKISSRQSSQSDPRNLARAPSPSE